ncbi:MAG: efflux RND transporter periplasmic adaptor subunit [Bradyrhizobiaceae bacterium]|nr:efflux RND transporter periplasmic adaptor subunit [Bradyrhizobiaceae bacterium]
MTNLPLPLRLGTGAILFLALAACGDSGSQTNAQKGAPPAPPVTVAAPVKRTVVDRDEYVGRFVAVDSVEIRARVSGYLDAVHFTDGELVKEGELLFTIDQRPFKAALDQARADLQRAKAQVDLANSDLTRAQDLIERKTISEAIFEQRVQAKRAADAQLQAAEAAVRNAELNLEFTELRSPIAGRIGDRRVSRGNLVVGGSQPSTSLLATIVSTDPIRFEFTFDEAAFLRYARLADGGTADSPRGTSMQIELRLLDEQQFSHKGKIDFIDNVIEQASGTIRGRAVFENPKALFTPGMFARVRMPASAPFEALLVPDTAVGTEQVRKFVYVVDGENTVRQKYVTLGHLENGLRVILKGIDASDRIIVNGQMRARPGAKVTPLQEGEQPSGAPGGATAKAK